MYSQKRMIALLVALVTIFACTMLLAKDNSMGIAEKRTITLTTPSVVGGTLLPVGSYNVTHEMSGQTHVMTFKQVGGKAEAKANCNLVPLKAKAQRTELRFTQNAKNERVLQEMTFGGDTSSHVLVQ
jgi:hypothetical protein